VVVTKATVSPSALPQAVLLSLYTIFAIFTLSFAKPHISIFSNNQNKNLHWDSSLKYMHANEIAESITRIMGFPAPQMVGPSSPNPLPTVSPFDRPQANLLITISGGELYGWSTDSFIGSREQHGVRYQIGQKGKKVASIFGQIMGQKHPIPLTRDLVHHGADVLCATAHENARQSYACQTAHRFTYTDQTFVDETTSTSIFNSASFISSLKESIDNSIVFSQLLGKSSENKIRLENNILTIQLHGIGSAVMDLNSNTDLQFLMEMEFLARLPQLYEINQDTPSVIIASFSQFKMMLEEFGQNSDEVHVIAAITDLATELLYQGFSNLYPNKLVAQVLLSREDDWGFGFSPKINFSPVSRRLLSSSNSSNSTNYTISEIANYNMCAWTGVFLILVLLTSIYMLATMDIGRDSLIYAKFQTDLSNAKND